MQYKNLILDDFQEQAIKAIQKRHSVIVSAPTGTGKTIIADYLIEHTFNEEGRIIYTSPIKALSNQKFREYCELVGQNNVGLITGDFRINATASVLIMTTEILRNILYSDDQEFIDSIKAVVFDEVHYLANIERGVAWEECIIKLPDRVQIIGLSATIPNVQEVADWISFIKNKNTVHIQETERAVPLNFFLFSRYSDLAPIQNKEMVQSFINSNASRLAHENMQKQKKQLICTHVEVVHALGQKFFPMLYFIFSRRQCEENAYTLAKSFNLLDREERQKVEAFTDQFFAEYDPSYFHDVDKLKSVLIKGIGFHHSGMNPLYKRLVEMLVEKGLVKVLYCTSTFALGLNFPVKTVVFGAIVKFNGKFTVPLTVQQFHQKAGRAGRRGIDTVGNVVITAKMRDYSADRILAYVEGKPERINSAFNLSYNSIVNILFEHSMDEVKELLAKSLWAYQNGPEVRYLYSYLKKRKAKIKKLKDYECEFDPTLRKRRKKDDRRKISHLEGHLKRLKKKIGQVERNVPKQENERNKRARYLRKLQNQYDNNRKRLDNIWLHLEEFICRDCLHYEECGKQNREVARLRSEIVKIERLIKSKENFLFKEFTNKVEVLQRLKYLDEQQFFETGALILRDVQISELLMTEMIMAGVFEDLEPDMINAMCASLGAKSSARSVFNYRLPALAPVSDKVEAIVKKLYRIGAIASKKEIEYDFGISGYAYMWSQGAEWEEIMDAVGGYDSTISISGDMVYAFRRGMDIVRQVLFVYRDRADVRARLQEAMERMDRDIIAMVI